MTLWDELFAPPESYGVFRPGLDQPPGLGDGDLDMSAAGVPGIVGRASPNEPPDRPLVVPDLLGRPRLRFGGCVLAAEERRRRWPALLEKEDWEASVTLSGLYSARNAQGPIARGFWQHDCQAGINA